MMSAGQWSCVRTTRRACRRRSRGPRSRAFSSPTPRSSTSIFRSSRMAERIATYSICACDLAAGQWGVATQSRFLAVGSVVPWAEPQVGAIATQSYANPRYGPDGLALLREGLPAEVVVERLTSADGAGPTVSSASSTRRGAPPRTRAPSVTRGPAERTGDGYAAQGNILVSGGNRRRARRDVRGVAREAPRRAPARLPRRGGGGRRRQPRPPVGGPARGRARRRLRKPLRRPGSTCGWTRPRIRSSSCGASTGCTTRCSARPRASGWLAVDGALRGGAGRPPAAGRPADLASWAGVENLEERVDGEDEIDPVVLERLRESA